MSESLSEFYMRVKQPGLKPRSRIDYEIQLRHFQEYLDHHLASRGRPPRPARLDDLSAEHLTGAVNRQLARGRERGTADKLRRVLLALWRQAAEFGLIAPPPAMPRLHARRYDPTSWSLEELQKIVEGAGRLPGPSRLDRRVGPFDLGEWFPLPVLMVANSGLRLDAMMQIRWEWIDEASGVMIVPPQVQKDDEGLTVTLWPSVRERLETLRRRSNDPCVFGDFPHDRRVPQWPALTLRLRWAIVLSGLLGPWRGAARSVLAERARRLGRRDLWHKLRRTFATQMYASSGDIEFVSDLLGHSSIDVTRRYIDKSKIGRRLQAETIPDPAPPTLRIFDPASDAG